MPSLIGSKPNQVPSNGDLGTMAFQDASNPKLGSVVADGLTVDTTTLVVDATNNRVGVGTASPGYALDVVTSGIPGGRITTAEYGQFVVTDGTRSTYIQNYAGLGLIGTSSNNALAITTNSTERMRITSAGVVELAQGQIKFPATQVASADANTLDDYEEGTFTPTVTSGITSPTYARQTGTYTKIGNLVHFQISIETNGGTRNSNSLRVGGLPFTQGDFSGGVAYTVAYVSNVVNSTTTNIPTLYGDSLQTHMSFYKADSSTFIGNDLQSASFRIDITGNYRV